MIKNQENIIFRSINFDDHNEIMTCVKIHNQMPTLWSLDFVNTIEDDVWLAKKISDNKNNLNVLYLLAILNDEIIGMQWTSLSNEHNCKIGNIFSMWVSPKHRNSVIAKRLNEKTEEWARALDVKMLNAHIHKKNLKVIKLTEYMGYIQTFIKIEKRL